MLDINERGSITKLINGKIQKLELKDVEEKELLLCISARLYSIRGILIYFTTLSVLSIIAAIIIILKSFSHY